MENKLDLIELLEYIDPASLGYQEWVNVGMALKQEGYTAVDWDQWSQSDSRYHSGECFKNGSLFKEPLHQLRVLQLHSWPKKTDGLRHSNQEMVAMSWIGMILYKR